MLDLGGLRRGTGAMLKISGAGTCELARSLLASFQTSGRPLSPQIRPPLLPHSRNGYAAFSNIEDFTIDFYIASSALQTLTTLHNNLLSALARFSYWWDFFISIAKLRLQVPKQWRGNIDCCFLFTPARNKLAAYAISESGVQLSATADTGSSAKGTKLHARCEHAR